MDTITIERIKTIHPLLRIELKAIYVDICAVIKSPYALFRFSHVLRTFKEQDLLYAQGRTTKGSIVTNAKGGDSYHNYGMAVDIVELLDKDKNGTYETASWDVKLDYDNDTVADWMEVVAIFKRYGWVWGGDWTFSDKPHFQKTFGYSISQLKVIPKDSNGYPKFNQQISPVIAANKTCECKCT